MHSPLPGAWHDQRVYAPKRLVRGAAMEGNPRLYAVGLPSVLCSGLGVSASLLSCRPEHNHNVACSLVVASAQLWKNTISTRIFLEWQKYNTLSTTKAIALTLRLCIMRLSKQGERGHEHSEIHHRS